MRRGGLATAGGGALALLLIAMLLGCPPGTGSAGDGEEPAEATGIVSLAPNLTEWICALGCRAELVGVTNHCDHPAGLEGLARVGPYNAPSIEHIILLAPRLVVCPEEGLLGAVVDSLRQMGIRVETFAFDDLATTRESVSRLGQLLGRDERAAGLLAGLDGQLAHVSQQLDGRAPVATVLLVDWETTLVAGPGTLQNELIERAGGRNVAAGVASHWPSLSPEVLTTEVAVVLDVAMAGQPHGVLDPAVGGPRIVRLDPDLVTRAGPRLGDAIEAMARALHPDAF